MLLYNRLHPIATLSLHFRCFANYLFEQEIM
nr:MAG TPA: hypothetical protein [Caudoviricetes sp.]